MRSGRNRDARGCTATGRPGPLLWLGRHATGHIFYYVDCLFRLSSWKCFHVRTTEILLVIRVPALYLDAMVVNLCAASTSLLRPARTICGKMSSGTSACFGSARVARRNPRQNALVSRRLCYAPRTLPGGGLDLRYLPHASIPLVGLATMPPNVSIGAYTPVHGGS